MQKKKKRQDRAKATLATALRSYQSLRLREYVPSTRAFSVRLYVVDADEHYVVPECHGELTIKDLKSRLELLVGIPFNFQRLHYLDEADLMDDSTLRKNDVIPGGTLTMHIWSQDAWKRLVTAAATGNVKKLQGLGATKTSLFSTAHADRLKPEEKDKWLDHRAFVALFVTVRRGHLKAVEFLLQNGADLRLKTPLGRTALHVAAASGKNGCIDILLQYGAKINVEDCEGRNAVILARMWGQKESERKLFRFQWKAHAAGRVRSSIKPKLEKEA